MRAITLSLLAMLFTTSTMAQEVFDPEAFGMEPYSAETASEIYLLCGENYAMALPEVSIGYMITAKATKEALTFQVLASGFDHPTLQVKNTAEYPQALAETAEDGLLFAVFEPIKGSTTTVALAIHGRVDGACGKLIEPQTISGYDSFPELVKEMINEEWNR